MIHRVQLNLLWAHLSEAKMLNLHDTSLQELKPNQIYKCVCGMMIINRTFCFFLTLSRHFLWKFIVLRG